METVLIRKCLTLFMQHSFAHIKFANLDGNIANDSFCMLHRYTSRWRQMTVVMSESLTCSLKRFVQNANSFISVSESRNHALSFKNKKH